MSKRIWFVTTLVAAVTCAVLCILAWIDLTQDLDAWDPTLTGAITGMFFLGGFALSLGVDALLLHLRRHDTVTAAEAVLIGLVIVLIVVLIGTGLSEAFVEFDFVVWPIAVVIAIATTIVIGVGNARGAVTTEVAEAAFVAPPPPPVP